MDDNGGLHSGTLGDELLPMKYERGSHGPLLDVLMSFISLKRLRKNLINNKANDEYGFHSKKRRSMRQNAILYLYFSTRKFLNPGN